MIVITYNKKYCTKKLSLIVKMDKYSSGGTLSIFYINKSKCK